MKGAESAKGGYDQPFVQKDAFLLNGVLDPGLECNV